MTDSFEFTDQTADGLFSHADLQRHLTAGGLSAEDAPQIIDILIGLMAGTGDAAAMTASLFDGGVAATAGMMSLASCRGAIVIASTADGYDVSVYGDPWADFAAETLTMADADGAAAPGVVSVATYDEYLPGFTGGVRVATGDFNGDGGEDVIITLDDGARFALADGAVKAVKTDANGALSFSDVSGLNTEFVETLGRIEAETGAAPSGIIAILVGLMNAGDGFVFDIDYADGLARIVGDAQDNVLNVATAAGGARLIEHEGVLYAAGEGAADLRVGEILDGLSNTFHEPLPDDYAAMDDAAFVSTFILPQMEQQGFVDDGLFV